MEPALSLDRPIAYAMGKADSLSVGYSPIVFAHDYQYSDLLKLTKTQNFKKMNKTVFNFYLLTLDFTTTFYVDTFVCSLYNFSKVDLTPIFQIRSLKAQK